MSNTSKVVIGVIVAAILIVGIYALVNGPMSPSVSTNSTGQTTSTAEPSSNVSATDTSDQALTQDMTTLDAQASALNADNANTDANLSK